MTSQRREPDSLSWNITPETVFKDEVEFHRVDDDYVVIERWDAESDAWVQIPGDEELRLTLVRFKEEEESDD